MKSIFYSALFCIIIFSSCCKSDDFVKIDPILLPVKLTSSNAIEMYSYDDQNRLVGLHVSDSSHVFEKVYSFIYQEDKMIKSLCNYISNESSGGYSYSETYDFSYNNDDLIVDIFFEDNSGFSNHNTEKYKIDNEGNLKTGYGIDVLYYFHGNISKIIDSGRVIEVFYDTQKGMYSQINSDQAPLYAIHRFGHFFRFNNPITILDSELGDEKISYQYNEFNYPVKIFVVESDFDERIEEVEYLVK